MEATRVFETHVVGREPELATLRELLRPETFPRALVLSGEPGVGKTALWEAGIRSARDFGMRVLSTRPVGAETQLSFAAVTDLLDDVDVGTLEGVPAPQLRALEVALLRAEPAGEPPAQRAVAHGFMNALRSLATREPLLVAIDDLQWVDAASSDVLAYAGRRLEGAAVGLLLSRRQGRESAVEQALGGRLQRLEVGPLSLGAIRRLLLERLGLSLPRHVLRRLVDATIGNPLFALELGRSLAEDGLPAVGEELPLPDTVEDLLGLRVARVSAAARRLLLAVALSGDLRVTELGEIARSEALDDALDAGVLLVEGDHVRASHPLLAAAAVKRSRSRERRELHLELARVAADERVQALHLAHATETPDGELAAKLATAAAAAARRAGWHEAAELAEHALRLTPRASPERTDRLLAFGDYLTLTGERDRAKKLLSGELASLPEGSARGRAWVILAQGPIAGNGDIRHCLERALGESGDDPGLHASALANLAENTAVICVARIREAEEQARQALETARSVGPDIERLALYALSWPRGLRGLPIDDLCERHRAASDAVVDVASSPERVLGQRLVWRGEANEARGVLARLLSVADDQGEGYAYALQRLHLCELELRVGGWDAAAHLLDEWAAEPSDRELVMWPMYERCQALLALGVGLPAEADRWAENAIARAKETGVRWDELEGLRARGTAALLAHDSGSAAESLRMVWAYTAHEGVEEPGVFPVAPDLVEALAELGELDEARAVTDRLGELAYAQAHPWGRVSATRCDAVVRLASTSYDEAAAIALEGAAAAYAELGLRFDCARTLLLLGRLERRHRKWARARRALELASSSFAELGSSGWVEEARSELDRVAARKPRASGKLTPAEQRVAGLAADGLSNREIAQALFVTVKTVEVHLSHAYAKLGVRSRAQLARRLSPPS